jgi:hypothetical protein
VAVLFRWTGIDPPFLVRINRGHGVCGFDVGVFGYRARFGNGDYGVEKSMKQILIHQSISELSDEIFDRCLFPVLDDDGRLKTMIAFQGELDDLADLCVKHDARLKNDRIKSFTIYRDPDHEGYWGFEY